MVSGPTTAISAVVFSALSGQLEPGSPEFIQGAILLALLVGILQLLFVVARVGRLAGFVSNSVMIGFTAAAAILIGVSQLGAALGLPKVQAQGILDRLANVVQGLPDLNYVAVISAMGTLITVAFTRSGVNLEAGATSPLPFRISPGDTCAYCDKRVFEECAERPDRGALIADARGNLLAKKKHTKPI